MDGISIFGGLLMLIAYGKELLIVILLVYLIIFVRQLIKYYRSK